jgi:transcription antitermination factor NusA-like protein
MAGTIDMRLMRYINLFGKISKVPTTNCFVYNKNIVFAVPSFLVSRAVGSGGENVRKMGETLRKKIKVISLPKSNEKGDIEKFVSEIVSPITFNKIEFKDGMMSISAGRASKAALIGRDRAREKELFNVLKNFFTIERLRVV